jgi:hypothetical protein
VFVLTWKAAYRIERFADLVLREAQADAARGEFDRAYAAFEYLHQEYSAWPGLPGRSPRNAAAGCGCR